MQYSRKMTRNRANGLLIFAWCLGLVCALPPLFGWSAYVFSSIFFLHNNNNILRMINDDTPAFWHSTAAPEHFSSSSTIQNLRRSNQSISLVDAKTKYENEKWKKKKKKKILFDSGCWCQKKEKHLTDENETFRFDLVLSLFSLSFKKNNPIL